MRTRSQTKELVYEVATQLRSEGAPALVRAMIGILLVVALIAQQRATSDAKLPPGAPPQARCQAAATAPERASTQSQAAPAKRSANPTRYHPDRFAGRAGRYYLMVWGIDSLAVRWAESGELIRFTYRVLDADKAKALNDKRNEPSLIDPRAGVKLVVPAMENVGQLRQSTTPEDGKSYWMTFSNKGRLVKRGDHVAVVIGAFHADGLVVD